MGNLTIKTKLYSIIAGVTVLLIILGFLSITSLQNINEKSSAIAKLWLPRVDIAGKLNLMTSDYRVAQYNHIVSDTQERMAFADKTMETLDKQIDEAFAEYDKLLIDDNRRENMLKIKAGWEKYVKDTAYILELSRQNKTVEAGQELMGPTRDDYLRICDELIGLSVYSTEGANKASAEGDEEFSSAALILICVIVVVVSLTIGSLYLITRNITNGIQGVLTAAQKIAGGDLKISVNTKGKDEIALLSQAIMEMANNLKALIGQIQKTSGQVAASSEELTASADQTAEVTQTIAQSVTSVAGLSNNQVSSVNEASHVIEQISAGIEESAAAVGMAAQQTGEAVETAKRGNETINNAVAQMNNIEGTVNRSAQVVMKLGERSKEIGQIVDTISGIAGQTNLLALNAAIEAARAGEQGKGFAVVAEEVRKLAEQSQEAAKRIESLISEIQGDTDKAVVAMNEGTEEVRQGSSVVGQAGTAFISILEMVDNVNAQAVDLAKTMEDLAKGTERIVSAVQYIDDSSKNVAAEAQSVSAAAEEQSASMEEIAAASRNLASLAQELQAAGNKFTL